MIQRLQENLDSWKNCDPQIKEVSKLFMNTWIIPNIEFCLDELKKKPIETSTIKDNVSGNDNVTGEKAQ